MSNFNVKPKKRVGLFVAYYLASRCSVIINSAIMLARANYHVDIFHYRAGDTSLMGFPGELPITLHDLNEPKNAYQKIISLSKEATKKMLPAKWSVSLIEKYSDVRNAFGEVRRVADQDSDAVCDAIQDRVYKSAWNVISRNQYVCFVGYDLGGFGLAGLLADRANVPVLYHSLELHLSDDALPIPGELKPLKFIESAHISKIAALIIQDHERGQLFSNDAGLENPKIFYVPVSGLGEPIRKKNRFFHEYFSLNAAQKVLLHVGGMGPGYRTDELMSVAGDLPEDWVLVFHGNADPIRALAYLSRSSISKVFLSLKQVTYDLLPDLVTSGDIGLVFLDGTLRNNFHTGLSSDKIALYMRCGIPAITPYFPSFRRIMEGYKCGVSVSDPASIPEAILEIQADYQTYRENAYCCYIDNYEFSRHFAPVIDFIDHL